MPRFGEAVLLAEPLCVLKAGDRENSDPTHRVCGWLDAYSGGGRCRPLVSRPARRSCSRTALHSDDQLAQGIPAAGVSLPVAGPGWDQPSKMGGDRWLAAAG